MRARVGRLLRRWANRIDPAGAMRKAGYSYTVERGNRAKNPNGIAVHIDGTGCPFWIIPADASRAWTEAATDWRTPSDKLADMLWEFGSAVVGTGPIEARSVRPKIDRATGGPVLPPQPMPYDQATDGPIVPLKTEWKENP